MTAPDHDKAPMGGAERAEDVLRRRAERLAHRPGEERRRALVARVAVVTAGTQRFAIPVEGLREIVPLTELTPLPDLEPWRLGLTQVRGDVLGVVDLAALVGAGKAEPRFLAVLVTGAGPMGLAVESVVDFRELHEDELAAGLAAVGDAQRVVGVVTRDLIGLVDLERLQKLQARDGGATPPRRA